jgi:transmembrane sensor
VANINPQELDRTLAWRRGVLNIQGQPLGEVIAEVERYTATRFVIADPALTAIEVGGYFKATDIEAFLTLLEGQFPIRAERPGPGVIVLHHRAAAPG